MRQETVEAGLRTEDLHCHGVQYETRWKLKAAPGNVPLQWPQTVVGDNDQILA